MNSSGRYLSRNRSSNSSHDTPSKAMYNCARSVFHHKRALAFSWKTAMRTFTLEVYLRSEKHIAICINMPRRLCLPGRPRTREIYLLEFTVNDNRNDRHARRNLSGCRRPGLVSVQSVDQCLKHALKGSCHPNNNRQLLSIPFQEPARLPGVRPLRHGCYWRRHAYSLNTPSSGSATSPNP
jgi:hypothetical protein